jgi:c-di-GMP-binding flagellar brake protein YcgR
MLDTEHFVERRKMVRLCITCPLEFSRKKEPENMYRVLTRDISGGGVQIHHTAEALEEGEVILLRMFLPQQHEPIEAEGMIVWKREVCYSEVKKPEQKRFDSGVKFITIDEKDLARIFRYIYEIGLHGIEL